MLPIPPVDDFKACVSFLSPVMAGRDLRRGRWQNLGR